MLKTEEYKENIIELYNQGFTAKEISVKLNFKYHQPVYNLLKKCNLKLNERIYSRKYLLDENYFNKINTEEKAYILGFICADGHIAKDRIVITLSIKDEHILNDIKKVMKSDQILTYSKRKNPYDKGKEFCEMVTLQLSSNKLAKSLLDKGLYSDKTYTLNSKILKHIPNYLIRDFLRGYFDGDGNVFYGKKYKSGIKYNINICGNEEFLINTYQKYFPSTNKLYFEKKSKQMFVWKISSKQQVKYFLYFLYNNSSIHLKRKQREYLKSKHGHIKPI